MDKVIIGIIFIQQNFFQCTQINRTSHVTYSVEQQFLICHFRQSVQDLISLLKKSAQALTATLILGWTTFLVSIYWYYHIQLTRYLCNFSDAGPEPVICSVQVDILTTNWQISLPLFQLAYWSFQYFRHKPPWSYINTIISWFFLSYVSYHKTTLVIIS